MPAFTCSSDPTHAKSSCEMTELPPSLDIFSISATFSPASAKTIPATFALSPLPTISTSNSLSHFGSFCDASKFKAASVVAAKLVFMNFRLEIIHTPLKNL